MAGSELRPALKYLSMTQKELAKRLGVSEVTVSKWVSYDAVPDYCAEYLRILGLLLNLVREY